jgi:hypothetical protein
MRRFWVLVLGAAVLALIIWYCLRVAEKNSPITVTFLLPKETLLLAHLPDFNRTRAQWHESDLYQIWREPAVQDFFQKPLSKIPNGRSARENFGELERLELKDAFFAITFWAAADVKAVGGFRFKGSAEDAEKVVGKWRARLLAKFADTKRETIEYHQHQIQTVATGHHVLATVYDEDWFFASNDLSVLKTIVDRADGRVKDRGATLAADDKFSAAFKHMPSSYAALVYGRLDRYFEKMMPLLNAGGLSVAESAPLYRQVQAFCGTLTFDRGKMRDVLFLGMPKSLQHGRLSRGSLALGTKETFFYLASFLNLTKQLQWPLLAPSGVWLPAILQKFSETVASSGITLNEWNGAFGAEFGTVCDWPPNARLPSLLASVPVKDRAKADQVLAKLMTAEGTTWAKEEKEDVRYFSLQSGTQPLSLAPTLALSDRTLVAGTDSGKMEAAMQRSLSGNSELASSQNFQMAERAVATADQAFFYLDLPLLYTRLDVALRPILMMGALLAPSINQNVDMTKLPAGEIITKHLSPIVMSQNYKKDGYVTESVGPVTMYQVGGLALLGGGAMAFYQRQLVAGAGLGSDPSPSPGSQSGDLPTASPSPASSPTP